MKIYTSIAELEEEQSQNFDYWSKDGEYFHDEDIYTVFDCELGDMFPDQNTITIFGGRIDNRLKLGSLVNIDNIIEQVDESYIDMLGDCDPVFELIPNDKWKVWYGELKQLISDKFNELPHDHILSPLDVVEEFQVVINKEDLA